MDDILSGFKPVNVAKGPVTMTIAYSGVSFSKAAVQTLGNPGYVVLLLNEDEKKVALQVSKSDEPNAIAFYKATRQTGDVRWNYSSLKNSLSDLMRWNIQDHTYRVEGHYYTHGNILMFDLAEASQLR